ncbi:MAG: GTP cyclohydrolase II, partial [Beijerinckiaceae bacterium]
MTGVNRTGHIRLTSHPEPGEARFPIDWGAADAARRGPLIGTVSRPQDRNVIGAVGGAYSLYRALAVSAGALNPLTRPDLRNTHPPVAIGPYPQWSEAGKIVSLDPWGHMVADVFGKEIAEGVDIRPSIAITKARLTLPEIQSRMAEGHITADGELMKG